MQIRKKLSAVVVALSMSQAAQADYTGVTVFGDSLSDAGTFGASFTTNPGRVWSKLVSSELGGSSTPAQLFNGTGYTATGGNIWAQGGATVASSGYGVPMAESVSTQLATYLASTGGTASSNRLYALWAGANDVFTQLTAYGAGSITTTQLQANVVTAAQTMAGLVQQLQNAGARNIIVVNLPDMGQTPEALVSGATTAAALSNLSALYNYTLQNTMTTLGVNTLVLNSYGLFSEIIANPSAFGFTVGNTGVACTTSSSLTCTPATLVSPNAATTYLFADSVHPTTAGHQIVADYFLSVVEAPILATRAADNLSQSSKLYWASSDSRQLRFLNGELPSGKGDFYVQGQIARISVDPDGSQSGFNGVPGTLSVGFDRNTGDGGFIGAALSLQSTRFDVTASHLDGKVNGTGVGVNIYGGWRADRAYVNAAALLSTMNYTLKRGFALGVGSRTESGEATGSVKGARFEGGYDLGQGEMRHGPYAGLTFSHVNLSGYQEQSGTATALRFGEQGFNQLGGSLGYQLAWKIRSDLRLSGRLSAEHEFLDNQRDLKLGVVSTQGDTATSVGSSGHPTSARLALQADWNLTPDSSLTTVVGGNYASGAKQSMLSVNYALRF